ncbi:MAG TPA: iron ABC transporter permease [Acidimicrobiia bacterium]|jgi:iron complex transport system permease protein|nr:iron ABC transporter permease [Acidimicrobiia bacterium]
MAVALGSVLVVAVVGVTVGAAGLDPLAVLGAILDKLPVVSIESGLTEVESNILFEIRLPRVVLGALVGAVLAVAGASYQGVFRNALADPYLLGIAAGAGLGATIALATSGNSGLLPPFAFVGGMVAVGVTYALGRSVGGRSATTLVLAGVAVAAFATAVQTYILQQNTETLREVYAWILGRLVTVGWGEVWELVPYAVIAMTVLVGARRLLDVLSLGDDEATALGIDVGRVRAVVVIAATLATAAAVSVSGLIGFVGIIVPHTVRLLFGWSYRVIIPLSIMFGASFLMFADIIARTVAAPAEMPIGVVTAFFGAPFFLLVLRTMRGPT